MTQLVPQRSGPPAIPSPVRAGAAAAVLSVGGLLLTGGAIAAGASPALIGIAVALGAWAFIVGRRRRARAAEHPTERSPAPSVAMERGRRLMNALNAAGGSATYARLRTELKWTDDALVTTLAALKEDGKVEEDVDLDTGGWVYRLEPLGHRGAAEPSLEERMRQLEAARGDAE